MPPRTNPLKLNKLQLKTLTLFQELAGVAGDSMRDESTGGTRVNGIPAPHGDHFHIGDAAVLARDATGLRNEGAWMALIRKGLAADGVFPFSITITPAGLGYDTGLRDKILHDPDH